MPTGLGGELSLGVLYHVDSSLGRDEKMYRLVRLHHVLAKLWGMHVHVYSITSNHTKKVVLVCEIYKNCN